MDTHKIIGILIKEHNLDDRQAEGIVNAILQGQSLSIQGLATTKELDEVKTILSAEISAVDAKLSAEIGEVRKEISAVDTKLSAEIGAVRKEIYAVNLKLSADIAEANTKLSADIAEVNTKLSADIAEVNTKLSADITQVGKEVDALGREVGEVKAQMRILLWILPAMITAATLVLKFL